MLPESDLFSPHANFQSVINRAIAQSEVEGGVDLSTLAVGARIEVTTKSRVYQLENRGDGKALISGHPEYCPQPVLVNFVGSTCGTPMIKLHFIGRGMKMEFRHPEFALLRSSRVQEIHELNPAPGRYSTY